MGRFIAAINASAQEWGVSKRIVWWIFWLPLIGAVLVAGSRINRQLFTFLTMEDGPIEWPQFLSFFGAALAGFGIAVKRFRAGHPWQALMFLAFGLGAFVIAGEEISWGQRIFGWQTPEELAAINHQGETTMHNIRSVQDALGIGLTIASGLAMLMPWLSKKYQFGQRWDQGNFLFAPPLFAVTLFFTMFAYKVTRFVAFPESEFTVTKYGEWPELCFAAGLCVFAYLNYRRLTFQPAPSASVAGGTPAAKGQPRVAK